MTNLYERSTLIQHILQKNMPKFSFEKIVDVNRDKFFTISTDYEKFTVILPDYFKDLKIIEIPVTFKRRIGKSKLSGVGKKKTINIGNGQGFWGDSIDAPLKLVNDGAINYLTLDYLFF